jgi:bleomycin hydrolase
MLVRLNNFKEITMKKHGIIVGLILFSFCSSLTLLAQENKVIYEEKKKDKVLSEIEQLRKEGQKKKQSITEKIRDRQKEEKKKKDEERKVLTSDMAGVYPPEAPEQFKQYFHFPPIAQYYTSTCWSFSATSFLESEIFRLTGKKIKLSEMWAPYFELIEKCRRYIQERGKSYVAGGAESNSVTRMWIKHGIVPAEQYPGVTQKGAKHDHTLLMREVKNYLAFIKNNELWDEEDNLNHIHLILQKHLGIPHKTFTYQGKTMTSQKFLKEVTGLKLDDYCSVMSTKFFPFYTHQEFRVPDNWWHSKVYINLPLDVWYGIIKKAIKSGYTLVIGGDISEPGKLGSRDVAFIPSFDIPQKYINQDSREYRIYNKTTEDDHGVHLVGYKRYKGHDWFLIKDSARSARYGKHNGYYFFRGDYIRLKMLTFTIHKDMLKDILPKLKK